MSEDDLTVPAEFTQMTPAEIEALMGRALASGPYVLDAIQALVDDPDQLSTDVARDVLRALLARRHGSVGEL